MRKILFLTVAALLVASGATAATQTARIGGNDAFEIVRITTASLATNAIDTVSVVGPVSPYFQQSLGAANDSTLAAEIWWNWPINFVSEGATGTGGSGTVDSIQVAIDISADGVNWVQAAALGNLSTGTTPTAETVIAFGSKKGSGLEFPKPYVRLRFKNTGAATGTADCVVSWLKK